MDPVTRHVTLFNTGVRTGDFAGWLATFTDDVTAVYVGLPIGPFHGRDALAKAYMDHPPSSTMRVLAHEAGPEWVRARFVWDAAPDSGGVFGLELRGGLVCALTVTLDAAPPPPANAS